MILVDTSVWVEHFRNPLDEIEQLAGSILLVQHPFVTGELALGDLRERESVLTFLSGDLGPAPVATEAEFLAFVEAERLAASGIGFVDAHLLASCRLLSGTFLWSYDRRLNIWAKKLGLMWRPS